MVNYVRTGYILYNKYIFIKYKHCLEINKTQLTYEYKHMNTVTKSEQCFSGKEVWTEGATC